MQVILKSNRIAERPSNRSPLVKEIAVAAIVIAVAVALYGSLFNRETTLSYSLGYNLYGAERALEGEAPYRDFHTLYPPGTVYVNAALFELFGVTLIVSLFGVFIFKLLTVAGLYLCARRLMPVGWAAAAALTTLVWLRPNGPFKAVPMHYGGLFLALALALLLAYCQSGRRVLLLCAGLSIGCLALFKHNIAAFALIGALAVALFARPGSRPGVSFGAEGLKKALALAAGFALPVAPVLAWMWAIGALAPMARALLFGPGEFLLSRLASTPSPIVPIISLAFVAGFVLLVARRKEKGSLSTAALAGLTLISSGLVILGGQRHIDSIIFYAPVAALLAATIAVYSLSLSGEAGAPQLLATLAVAGAAFMESFPRFAREQAIGAMPFVVVLVFYLLYIFKERAGRYLKGAAAARVALVFFPLIFFLIGARMFVATYMGEDFRLKSSTPLGFDRGRGVYFPEEMAREITAVVEYIKEKVPEGGYFFAQSYAGSSYLFLADRNNPSGAQFWGGVGVSDLERQETLAALDRFGVNLIVTSEKDLAAEPYAPMREKISREFTSRRDIGGVVILERAPG